MRPEAEGPSKVIFSLPGDIEFSKRATGVPVTALVDVSLPPDGNCCETLRMILNAPGNGMLEAAGNGMLEAPAYGLMAGVAQRTR
jgi:hypothetical protein